MTFSSFQNCVIYKYATFYFIRAGPAHYAEPRQSSFFGFFRLQIYVFLHYAILGKMENMGEKLCKRLHSYRLNPLNDARFPMSYAVLNLTSLLFYTKLGYVYAISKSLQMVFMK